MGHHLRHIHLAPLAWRVGSEAFNPRNHLLYSAGFEEILHTPSTANSLLTIGIFFFCGHPMWPNYTPEWPPHLTFFNALGSAALFEKVFCPKRQALRGMLSRPSGWRSGKPNLDLAPAHRLRQPSGNAPRRSEVSGSFCERDSVRPSIRCADLRRNRWNCGLRLPLAAPRNGLRLSGMGHPPALPSVQFSFAKDVRRRVAETS